MKTAYMNRIYSLEQTARHCGTVDEDGYALTEPAREALRSMIESHSDMTEGNLYSGAPVRVAVKREARALLSRMESK